MLHPLVSSTTHLCLSIQVILVMMRERILSSTCHHSLVRGRLDASLVLDPSLIVKLRGSRIELGQEQLLAEGQLQSPVVFAVRWMIALAPGAFDTNNDNNLSTPPASPSRGDWAGIYAGPTSNVSFDAFSCRTRAASACSTEGSRGLPASGTAAGRRTNYQFRIQFNDDGQDGAGPAGRFGRLAVCSNDHGSRITADHC